jgi:hypothetical protein
MASAPHLARRIAGRSFLGQASVSKHEANH